MPTPWGVIPVGDAHIHFFSHRFFSLLASQRPGPPTEQSVEAAGATLGWEMPPPEPERLAARWVEELDRYGVSRAALIASLPGDEDSVAAAVGAYPERFFGYFMVDPCAPDALARVQKALAGGRLRGVCLFPAMHRYSLHDERVTAVLELAACQPAAVIFVHCGVLTVGVRQRLGLPSQFDLRYSNPVDLHALALRYPRLRFVIPHFGAGYFREALMVADLCPNVYFDTSSSNQWIRYLAPEIDLKTVFRRSLDVLGARRLLFGTDSSFFPRGWNKAIFDTQAEILRDLGLSEEEARWIFGENLERIFSNSREP
ncbi:MAG: amidohydrolase family protein [Bryobacterales bacterium]|nr:amidohydrolase [Bryobacteraceae bacterium]MDW8354869.1 amidohydrolase family protein [Bryobacterales bacterium]